MEVEEAGKESTSSLMFEFLPLFHRHFLSAFHEKGALGLTKSQNKALMIIRDRGSIIQSDLGTCLDMTKGSLTTLIDSLERTGLTVRTRDGNDRRKYWLTLTEAGVRYTLERERAMETHIGKMLDGLSPESREKLRLHLSEIIRVLKELERVNKPQPNGHRMNGNHIRKQDPGF